MIQLMMQQVRPDDAIGERAQIGLVGDGSAPDLGVLNRSEQILLLIDEAHRTQSGTLHAQLSEFLPNAAKIGFTGTPIVRSVAGRPNTRQIFGSDVDEPYTLIQSEQDGATVPIRYEGRHVPGVVVDRLLSDKLESLLRGLDGAWESLADELGSLVGETLAADAEVEAYALDPLTEGPIFNILVQGISHAPQSVSRDLIADISRDLTGYIRIQVGPPHFPTSDHLQQNLRRELRKRIAHAAGISRQESGPLAEQIMATIIANPDRFLS